MIGKFWSDGGEERQRVVIWLLCLAALGSLMVPLYPDADQLDSGYHYLFARWSWVHPEYLLSVWARPLFTLLYSVPAQLGYGATRLFTLLLCLLTAWQTWRLARELGLARPELAIPLLFLQPVFWQLSTGVFTESLFALLLVIALRLESNGRRIAAILVVSLLILVRPEGFFIGMFWGAWHTGEVFGRKAGRGQVVRRLAGSLLLAGGMATWWGAAWLMTGDPLWIIHHWPPDWNPDSQANGTGPVWWYLALLPLIVGPLALPAFLSGARQLWREGIFRRGMGAFATIFIVHSILYTRGWFGAAGYARYFVCVAPVTAIVALAGWPDWGTARWRRAALAAGLIFCVIYGDVLHHGRDAIAIRDLYQRFRQSPATGELPVTRLVNSQPYMRIIFDRDHWEMPGLSSDRDRNLATLRGLPPGTLVFWDAETGPGWYHLTPVDLEAAGFELLLSRDYLLTGRLLPVRWRVQLGARPQTMSILYKR
jgi:hypothetical protein